MSEDLIAKLRAVKVLRREEVLVGSELLLDTKADIDKKSASEWSRLFREHPMKRMASVPDYYKWFSDLEKMYQAGRYEREHAIELRDTFCDEIYSFALLADTIITYDGKWGKVTMRHNHCSPNDLITHQFEETPRYNMKPIRKIIGGAQGRELMQRYFGTQDSPKRILEVFEFMVGKEPDICFSIDNLPEGWREVGGFSYLKTSKNSGYLAIGGMRGNSLGYARGIWK